MTRFKRLGIFTLLVLLGLTALYGIQAAVMERQLALLTPPSDNFSDWSEPHIVINWPQFIAFNALLIAGVGLVVWIIVRKRK
jgi:hypothetical protein